MKKRPLKHRSIKTTLAVLAAATLLIPTFANAWSLPKGGNWADDGDNFQDGFIIPAGIISTTNVAQAQAKADQIASNLAYVGANFVRIGINPASTSDQPYWLVMKGYINELIAKGFNVDLCCWDGSDKDGIINNMNNWKGMWEKVDGVYGTSAHVWYEPFNEPHGYTSESQLATQVYVPFLSTGPTGYNLTKLQGWMILDGTGDANDVTTVGADSRFTGCKLGLHIYPTWWGQYTTESGWESALNTHLLNMQGRTVLTEMGAPAISTPMKNYSVSSSDVDVCFIRGICTRANQLGVGIIYWPSHKDGDTFRLFVDTTSGSWTNPSLMNELDSLW